MRLLVMATVPEAMAASLSEERERYDGPHELSGGRGPLPFPPGRRRGPGFKSRVRQAYAEDVCFGDTLKTAPGGRGTGTVSLRGADAVERGTFEFLDLAVMNGNYDLRWEMTLRSSRGGTLHPGARA
jgi:hypothetical protein